MQKVFKLLDFNVDPAGIFITVIFVFTTLFFTFLHETVLRVCVVISGIVLYLIYGKRVWLLWRENDRFVFKEVEKYNESNDSSRHSFDEFDKKLGEIDVNYEGDSPMTFEERKKVFLESLEKQIYGKKEE